MLKRDYKTYLFDLDGTLIDTVDLIVQCFHHSLAYAATKYSQVQIPSDETIKNNIGYPLYESMQLYLGDIENIDYDEIVDKHMAFQQQNWKTYVSIYPGVSETLQKLKATGKKLAIVTSRRAQSTKEFMAQLKLLSFFDVLVTPEMTEQPKPAPDPALKAASLLAENPSDCLFIGDSEFDIRCATSANMDSAFVTWGATSPGSFSIAPTYTVSKMSELLFSK